MAKAKNADKRGRTNVRDNHHFIFPEGEYEKSGNATLREFRRLPCFQVELDIEVHELFHKIFDAPHRIGEDVMRWFIDRHNRKLCGCYDKKKRIRAHVTEIGGEVESGLPAATPMSELSGGVRSHAGNGRAAHVQQSADL